MREKNVQAAGREQPGDFAPMFAYLNDDVLFSGGWDAQTPDGKTKSIPSRKQRFSTID